MQMKWVKIEVLEGRGFSSSDGGIGLTIEYNNGVSKTLLTYVKWKPITIKGLRRVCQSHDGGGNGPNALWL